MKEKCCRPGSVHSHASADISVTACSVHLSIRLWSVWKHMDQKANTIMYEYRLSSAQDHQKGNGAGRVFFLFFFFFPLWEKLTVLCIGHFSVAVALWLETAGRKWSYLDMQLQRTNRPRDREALEQTAKVKEQECGSSHLVERSAWEWREVWNSPTQPVTCVLHQNCTCQ